MSIELTTEQQAVFDRAAQFIKNPRPTKPWFYFSGLAGVGKSVVLSALAKAYPGAALCAYTGKAASVLARKSGMPSGTIHSVIYQFRGLDQETQKPIFRPAHDDDDLKGDVALVDEVSMLDQYLMRDFLATGCKIVACGDPGQLPPVKGTRFFQSSDTHLTTIHRQAWDSAIIRQAHNIRETGYYVPDGLDFQVKQNITGDEILAADAIICYRNETRHKLNKLVRLWKERPKGLVVASEPVMCLKNNHKLGILNGAIYSLLADHHPGDGVLRIENERGEEIEVDDAWIEDFEPPLVVDTGNPFAHGHAITCHKAQGSSFRNIIVCDEYNRTEGRREWCYTSVTRAEEKVIVQRNW